MPGAPAKITPWGSASWVFCIFQILSVYHRGRYATPLATSESEMLATNLRSSKMLAAILEGPEDAGDVLENAKLRGLEEAGNTLKNL